MKLKLTKEQIDLFDQLGTVVVVPSNEIYYYLPFWFKKTEVKNVFDVITFEELPKEVLETINDLRESNGDPPIK
jgi:hypothetical protein